MGSSSHLSTAIRYAFSTVLVLLSVTVLGVRGAGGGSELALGELNEDVAQGYITELQDMDTDGFAEGTSSGMSEETVGAILVGILAIVAYAAYRSGSKAESTRLQRAVAIAEAEEAAAQEKAARKARKREEYEMRLELAEREHAIAERLASEANLDEMLIEWTGFEGSLTISDVETAIAAKMAEEGQANNDDELSPEDEELQALGDAADLAAQAELDGTAALQALRAPVEEARKALEAKSAAAARAAAAAAANVGMQPGSAGETS